MMAMHNCSFCRGKRERGEKREGRKREREKEREMYIKINGNCICMLNE